MCLCRSSCLSASVCVGCQCMHGGILQRDWGNAPGAGGVRSACPSAAQGLLRSSMAFWQVWPALRGARGSGARECMSV